MTRIIIDCDPGHDDAVAIMFAAASKEIDIAGITCVAGNTILKNTLLNALKICTFINRQDIKIYSGCEKPLKKPLVTADHVHGKSGLDYEGNKINIPNDYKIQKEHAVDFIIKECSNKNNKIILCPTGPLTNIAKAISIKKEIQDINQLILEVFDCLNKMWLVFYNYF